MSVVATKNPVAYAPELENLNADDDVLQNEVIESVSEIISEAAQHAGHAFRAVHAKSQAFVVGEMRVLPDLPEAFRQGLFAKPGLYPILMRFSTLPSTQLDDQVSLPRGLGLKIVGVEGARLPDFKDAVTQDFLLSNGPTFPAASVKAYARMMKAITLAVRLPVGAKMLGSGVAQIVGRVMKRYGAYDKKLLALGDYPARHVFNDVYCTQGALLFGKHVAKLEIVPVSPELRALGNVDLSRDPDALRNAANAFLAAHSVEWEMRAQLCVDPKAMPIEDPSVAWSEALSPYVPVARLRAAPQIAWSEERSALIDDAMSFNPWRGLADHRPLGAIMRLRRAVYKAGAADRMRRNGVALRDPRSADDLPMAPAPQAVTTSVAAE